MDPTTPTRYKRRYEDGASVSSEDLRAAYEVAAGLVAQYGEQYLPLFERLDLEIRNVRGKEEAKRRALLIARGKLPSPP